MSDILIRGMEMPCEEAEPMRIELYADGTVLVIKEQDDFYEFKAVSVQPHGRLIDADALLVKNYGRFGAIDEMAKEAIKNAPTVIGAEDGET
jgi:hypothetical protein